MASPFILGATLGLTGAVHCLGMCGPLAMTLPIKGPSVIQYSLDRLAYHSGRILIYLFLGWLLGNISDKLSWMHWQQYLSIGFGILFLLSAAIMMGKLSLHMPGTSLYLKISSWLGPLQKSNSLGFLILRGALNGLLPCGWLYIALTGALLFGKTGGSVEYMLGFGLGTWPVFMALYILGFRFGEKIRTPLRRLSPIFVSIIGLLLIVRGLGLGLPYLSPRVNVEKTEVKMDCCHK